MTALKEVAAVLAEHGRLTCLPTVDEPRDGTMTVTLQITPPIGLEALSLRHELEALRDLAQLRSLCDKYEIPAAALEPYLTKGG